MLPRLAALLVLGASTALGCGGSTAPPPSMASPLLDKQIPDFHRPALDGSTIDTASARGRVVVIKFFAQYCEPCKKTLPEVEALHKDRPDVLVLGIDEDELASDAQQMVQRYGLTFPVIHDGSNVLSGRFRVREMPVTFVADKQGTIRWVGGPAQTGDELRRAIDTVSR